MSQGIRNVVVDIIVREAMKGSAWRTLCAEVMRANQITNEDIEREVERRKNSATTGDGIELNNIFE